MQEGQDILIENTLREQRAFFNSGETKKTEFSVRMLKALKKAILKYEKDIAGALWKDLHKSHEEAYLTEISIVVQEINYHLKNLKKWSKPRKVHTPLHLKPSSSKIIYEPLGVALIISPWNYPFQLLFNPLVGAISAGCCVVLKPSEFTPHIVEVMQKIVQEVFEAKHVALVQGDEKVGAFLLRQHYDVIFFTGSTAVGKIVMRAAAENLTPVILELGGKSPCLVDQSADLEVAARRIAWGKSINAGQTCIAPDYLLVHEDIKDTLVKMISSSFKEMYGNDIMKSGHYPRIVHEKAFKRLEKLMEGSKISSGGHTDLSEKYIEPTILEEINPGHPIMEEEIFGPLLPVITYKNLQEALDFIQGRPKPLALYYFGKDNIAHVLENTTSGGVTVNDTLMHVTNHHLPFGGVGGSGLGKYHGKESFLAFSNVRGVVQTPTWLDLPMKYPPFRYFKWIKKII